MFMLELDPFKGKDLKDPAMTLENNPLARGECPCCESEIERRNRDRLHQDAHLRRDTTNGHVYSRMMDMRYGG